jgi:hypothetical protein
MFENPINITGIHFSNHFENEHKMQQQSQSEHHFLQSELPNKASFLNCSAASQPEEIRNNVNTNNIILSNTYFPDGQYQYEKEAGVRSSLVNSLSSDNMAKLDALSADGFEDFSMQKALNVLMSINHHNTPFGRGEILCYPYR